MRPVVASLLVVICAAQAALGGRGAVELVSSSPERVVVRCEVGEPVVRTLSIPQGDYVTVSIPGAEPLGIPGAPDLPMFRATVGIPDCDAVDMTISTTPGAPLRDVWVAPSPTVLPGEDGALSDYRYVEGEQYRAAGVWPPGAAAMGTPGTLGTQRVVEILLHPCQVDPQARALLVHSSIEVTLTFRGVRGPSAPRPDAPRRERMLETVLLNYESARQWRVGRQPAAPPERPGDSFETSANWLKMRVTRQAAHAVSPADLRNVGVSPASVDPRTIRVFSGTGLPLPENVTAPRPDWMVECDILVEGESDGVFDEGDRVVFCAFGPDGWACDMGLAPAEEPYYENPLSPSNVYWLTWESPGTPSGFSGEPRRMQEDDLQSSPSATPADAYWARDHLERNIYEWLGASDNWFWQQMQQSPLPERRQFTHQLNRVRTDSTAVLRVRVEGISAAAANPDHHTRFSLNGELVHVAEWEGETRLIVEIADVPVVEGDNTLEIFLPRQGDSFRDDRILVDWYDLEYWRELWAADGQLVFGSSGRTGEIRYTVGGLAGQDVSVFKVLDRYTTRTVPGVTTESGSNGFRAVFNDDVADTASYIVVSPEALVTPRISRDAPAGLRTVTAADYVMIAHDDFYDAALRLRSYRESAAGGGFRVRLVRVSDVYDDFSWGLQDPTAIRDFLKHVWDHEDVPPTHALLVGDTSADYRGYLASTTPCYIPAHYDPATYSRLAPIDAWYVGFSGVTSYFMAMALGRLPARSVSEINAMIDKIIRYESAPVFGPWRNTAILVADDQFKQPDLPGYCCEFFHTEQTEQLSTDVLPWPLDRRKIYLMEYPADAVGKKPAARADIIEAWNRGAILMNFTGHGNEIVLAHESVFLYDDVSLLRNIDALPLFFAASCRLNRFDQQTVDSMGELLMKSPAGGSICSIGSTRDSGAFQNASLNSRFIAAIFASQQQSTTPALDTGSAFQAAFTTTPFDAWRNNRLFAFLGDPAVTLAAPWGGGVIDTTGVEPMRRRDTVTVSGANQGSTEGSDGLVLLTARDCADTSGYFHVPPPGNAYHVRYTLPGSTVYRGLAPVADGEFAGQFVVSSASAEGRYARIGAYFYSGDADGSFSMENVTLRDSVEVSDTRGPSIAVEFAGGGTSVLPETAFSVSLYDENGIDLVGRGSPAITISFDGGAPIDVTGDFLYDVGEHRRGVIERRLPTLGLGGHTLTVSAADNIGNGTEANQWFEVVSAADFVIRNVASSPNPFPRGETEGTYILFQLPVDAEVGVDVFTVGGRLVRRIGEFHATAGANQVYWDGRDQQGDELANGVYLYRIHATSALYRGDRAEVIGRAVVMR